MIKVKHNGFDIEFDSVQDLNQFINPQQDKKSYSLKSKDVSEIATLPKKSNRHVKRNPWTVVEMKEIFDMVSGLENDESISRNPLLRQRHSHGAIRQMVDKVRSGNNLRSTSKSIGRMIKEYRDNVTLKKV